MKKWIKITSIVTAVIAVIVLAVAVSIAPLAKNYIEKHDRELLGRSIRMERLKFNIFTGRLRIGDLRIGGADDSTTFFRLDSFDMRMRLWPLLSNRVVVKKLSFAAPGIKVYQRGNSFSFDDILAHFAGDTILAAATPEKPSKPWEIGIYDISIRNGQVFYKDLLLDATWGMKDINLHIPGVYFSGEKTDVGAVLNFAEGGSLSTDVGYNIATSEFDIGIRLQDFALAGTLPYFRQALDVAAVDGRAFGRHTGCGAIPSTCCRCAPKVRPRWRVSPCATASSGRGGRGYAGHEARRGRHGVDAFSFRPNLCRRGLGAVRNDARRRQFLGADETHGQHGRNTGSRENIRKRCNGRRGTGSGNGSGRPRGRHTDAQDRRPGDSPGQRDGARPDAAPPVRIHRLADRHAQPRFRPVETQQAHVDARMQKTGSAKLRWEGALDNIDNQNITLWLSNLDLRDFGPYCEHFTAYPLTKGNLTFRSQNVIRDRYLDGTNHLDMFEPKVDRKRKDIKAEMNIPLKLGLYVLKDKKGHVKMDLPRSGAASTHRNSPTARSCSRRSATYC